MLLKIEYPTIQQKTKTSLPVRSKYYETEFYLKEILIDIKKLSINKKNLVVKVFFMPIILRVIVPVQSFYISKGIIGSKSSIFSFKGYKALF